MQHFILDERLEQDCHFVMDLELCRLLLMNESRYPWFIMVPRISGLKELMELTEGQEKQFFIESRCLQIFLKEHCQAQKLNVAALGNVVPQLHVHHIARYTQDAAWPAPVWGKFPPEPYEKEASNELIRSVKEFMKGENK